MSNSKAAVSRAELTRCLKAARDAGYEGCRLTYEKPDGTRVTLVAGKAGEGEAADNGDDIDAMIERLP